MRNAKTNQGASQRCDADGLGYLDVLDLMIALVDKSLIVGQMGGTEERYRLLESTRAYALDKLARSGKRDGGVKTCTVPPGCATT